MEGRWQTGMLRWVSFLVIAVSGASCGPPEADSDVEDVEEVSPEPQPSSASADHDETLEEHMQAMSAVPPDSLVGAMPMHLETLGAMLDEMDPAAMGMQADTVWRTTLDSLQNDLALMREMRAEELRTFMPEHSRRIERLIFLHDSAMGSER